MWFLQPGINLEFAILKILALLSVVFFILPFHEFAHGYVAYKLGDNTAKSYGRLSLNPLNHIDPIGTALLLITGCFGWAKPVPINTSNFKKVKLYTALTALAGPLSNLIAALIGGFLLNAIKFIGINSNEFLSLFFYFYIYINIGLATFNLLPIPPLDGFNIISGILPENVTKFFLENSFTISITLMVLLIGGVISIPLQIINSNILNFILYITSLPFGL